MIGGNLRKRSVNSDGKDQDQDINVTLAHVRVRDLCLLTDQDPETVGPVRGLTLDRDQGAIHGQGHDRP